MPTNFTTFASWQTFETVPELAIPATYFGNCLELCFVQMTGSELVGEDGVLAATKAIGNRVEELKRVH
ncbi:hypothetical protein V6N12_000667 [Hibiscus sabdariffa]|uniref:Uncharacterized protein n=1 Tax=Hibiscus sabdariffa TaxID=183260 RepID=A0ABR2AKE6_9ROSI